MSLMATRGSTDIFNIILTILAIRYNLYSAIVRACVCVSGGMCSICGDVVYILTAVYYHSTCGVCAL